MPSFLFFFFYTFGGAFSRIKGARLHILRPYSGTGKASIFEEMREEEEKKRWMKVSSFAPTTQGQIDHASLEFKSPNHNLHPMRGIMSTSMVAASPTATDPMFTASNTDIVWVGIIGSSTLFAMLTRNSAMTHKL